MYGSERATVSDAHRFGGDSMSGELTDGSAVKREQGRRANQLRALASEQAVLHRADGSATFSHGDTRCTASVYGPGQPAAARREVPDRAAVAHHFVCNSRQELRHQSEEASD